MTTLATKTQMIRVKKGSRAEALAAADSDASADAVDALDDGDMTTGLRMPAPPDAVLRASSPAGVAGAGDSRDAGAAARDGDAAAAPACTLVGAMMRRRRNAHKARDRTHKHVLPQTHRRLTL